MHARLNVIKKTFIAKGILLKDELDQTKIIAMQDSVTNQFMKVSDIRGNQYLVRLNGKLWPPFTRQDEDANLQQLKLIDVQTTVIANNTTYDFQICHLHHEKNKWSELLHSKQRENLLKPIAKKIKKFHQHSNFKNRYPVANTLIASLKRVSAHEKVSMQSHLQIILRLLSTLNADTNNHTAAHNDLLPSSIYFNEQGPVFVDWEYSGVNHNSYDLALLSLKSTLSLDEEKSMIAAYDVHGHFDMHYSVTMMKPVVNYLLLLWNASSKQYSEVTADLLLTMLTCNIQRAINQHVDNSLWSQAKFSLFKQPILTIKQQEDASTYALKNGTPHF